MSRKVDVFGDRLRSRAHQLTPRLLLVARYINENREAVMEQTAMEIATLLKTSDATVVRAIRHSVLVDCAISSRRWSSGLVRW